MGETINYEEDKVSPEKEDEKPIYESTEGPIPKVRTQRFAAAGTKQSTNVVGKSGTLNILNSGESFGISAIRSGGANRGAGVGQ